MIPCIFNLTPHGIHILCCIYYKVVFIDYTGHNGSECKRIKDEHINLNASTTTRLGTCTQSKQVFAPLWVLNLQNQRRCVEGGFCTPVTSLTQTIKVLPNISSITFSVRLSYHFPNFYLSYSFIYQMIIWTLSGTVENMPQSYKIHDHSKYN